MQPLSIALIITAGETANEVRASLADLPVRVVIEQPEVGEWGALLDKIERLLPDVILLYLGSLREPLEETLRKLKNAPGSPAIIAIHTATDPESILRAIRAGAAEYLYPPFNPALGAALNRIAGDRAQQGQRSEVRGKTMAFFSAKGGCGATTVACHVAVDLGRRTARPTLLADFDLDNGIVAFLMKTEGVYSMADALLNINHLDGSYWKALVTNGYSNLEIITAPVALSAKRAADPERLRHVLRFTRSQYDWVVVDLGRGLSVHSVNAMEEVDECYLVTTLDLPALHQAKQIVRTLRDIGYPGERLRLILNRVPKRTAVTTDEIQQLLGLAVTAVLPEDQALYESYADGKLLPPHSGLGMRLAEISSEAAGIRTEKKKRKFSLFG